MTTGTIGPENQNVFHKIRLMKHSTVGVEKSYVYMYVCMYACMYVCTYVRMYVCMYVCMYICMYAFYVHN